MDNIFLLLLCYKTASNGPVSFFTFYVPLRWITRYIDENNERWKKEKKQRESNEKETAEQWKKMNRLEKIKLLKEKISEDKAAKEIKAVIMPAIITLHRDEHHQPVHDDHEQVDDHHQQAQVGDDHHQDQGSADDHQQQGDARHGPLDRQPDEGHHHYPQDQAAALQM